MQRIKLIRQRWHFEHLPSEPIYYIEKAARTCYQSQQLNKPLGDLTKHLLERGHLSVIEHVSASVRIITDRGVTHELVRHRLASFSQESTRYCNYHNKDITFIIPVELEPLIDEGYYDWMDIEKEGLDEGVRIWLQSCIDAAFDYNSLISCGWTPGRARAVLNNSLKAEIVMTANLREWRHVFSLRTSKAAHPQMRALMLDMLKEFKSEIPIIFDDIGGGEND